MICTRTGRSPPPRPRYRYGDGADGGTDRDGGRIGSTSLDETGTYLALATKGRVPERGSVQERPSRSTRLALDERCGELERVGDDSLHLRDDLLDDVTRLLQAGT